MFSFLDIAPTPANPPVMDNVTVIALSIALAVVLIAAIGSAIMIKNKKTKK